MPRGRAAAVMGAEALGCAIVASIRAEAVNEANASFASEPKVDAALALALASESVSQLSADEAAIDEADGCADEEGTAAESCDWSSS